MHMSSEIAMGIIIPFLGTSFGAAIVFFLTNHLSRTL